MRARRSSDLSYGTQDIASWAVQQVRRAVGANGWFNKDKKPVLTLCSGYGALVINTHRLNSIKFESKCTLCDNHTGGVVKVGAGVMMKDLYAQAWPRNLDVLGGECPVSPIDASPK